MSTKIESAVERAVRHVDHLAEPGSMTQEEALEFYEGIATDVAARIDGLKTDLGES